MTSLHLGVSLSAGNATWTELRDGALLAESLGYDSIWSPDHFLTSAAAPDGPYLEAWQILPAWATLTTRVRLGPLVTPIDFRHPAILAKMAATLDRISNGRAILGLGAGWYEQEYAQYGLHYGAPAERLARLAETARICRSLFDEARTTLRGKYYRLTNARAEPKPAQSHLPILIGADGDRAIGVAGRHADWWNGFGSPDEVRRKLALLYGAAKAAGRDGEAITPSVTFRPVIVRDRRDEIDEELERVAERHRLAKPDTQWMIAGDVDAVTARLREYVALGVRTFVIQMRVPFDRESLERMAGEVRPRLES
ncbi:MAG TPA: LLM class flavin-dependent oxidoreductase [Candidatus Dormibacteraeota bacterium]|nr:LLM class flavin-dependent oxidoreductase [Candidatus Dormibacteraeota bacterium]